jgi:hypothetical protein
MAARDPVYWAGGHLKAMSSGAGDTVSAALLGATLAALAGSSWAANSIPVGTGAGTLAQTALAANTFLARSSAGNVAAKPISDAALGLLDDANEAAMRTTLGLVIGTNVQAFDAELAALASLTSAANKVPRFTGPGTADVLDFSTDGTLAANSDTAIPSQKAVKTYIDGLLASQDAMVYKGAINASANPNYPAADAGHTYRISVAGKIGGAAGPNVEAGDIVICNTDATAAGTHAAVGASWNVIQTNIDGALTSANIGSTVQAFDATLQALAGTAWAANSIAVGSGVDTVAQITLAANQFLARSSTGNAVAKAISDDALDFLAGASDAAMRTALGLGTLATQNANAVAITGGAVSGLSTLSASDVEVTSGYFEIYPFNSVTYGTDGRLQTYYDSVNKRWNIQARNAALASVKVELDINGTLTADSVDLSGGIVLGTPLAVAYGGTGGTTQATARTGLGLGTLATQNSTAIAVTGGTLDNLTRVETSSLLVNAAVSVIELGRQDGTAGFAYLDFHSGATVVNYDARIFSSGGSGLNGGGDLTLVGSNIEFDGFATALGDLQVIGTLGANDASFGTLFASGMATFNAGAQIVAGGSDPALWITNIGTNDALRIEDQASTDATPFVIDAAGRVINGHVTNIGLGATNFGTQIHGTGIGTAGMWMTSWSATTAAPGLYFGRSKGAAVETNTVVADGDALGNINAYGATGTGFSKAAAIEFEVDGEPITGGDTSDMPGRIVFLTTPNGSATPTEKMRITSSGVQIPGGSVAVTGGFCQPQPAHTATGIAGGISAAQVLTQHFHWTGAAGSINLPTGANLDTALTTLLGFAMPVDSCFVWTVSNSGTGTLTLTVAAGITNVGSLLVTTAQAGASFKFRKTATSTFQIIRCS